MAPVWSIAWKDSEFYTSWKKTLLFLGSGVALSAATYVVYRHYYCREERDEGFVDVAKTQEPSELKVLVLGLDGAGKSSVLRGLSGKTEPLVHRPNENFSVINLDCNKHPLALWKIGGAPSSRKLWSSFVQDTHILMYVVDSTDDKRLPESFSELHRILGDERLDRVPIIIVANKQDLPGAIDCESVLSALAMDGVNRQRRHVDCVATEAPSSGSFVGINELKALLERLSSYT